jgi:hypothetical protein
MRFYFGYNECLERWCIVAKKMGRPRGNRDDISVKIDRKLAAKIRYIAEVRGVSIASYLSGLVGEKVDLDFLEATKQK